MKRPQYFDNILCPHCRNINNQDVCKKCFYDSEYKPKQWHADAMAVPTHLKTVCSPFLNYYHPDGVFKLKERRMRKIPPYKLKPIPLLEYINKSDYWRLILKRR